MTTRTYKIIRLFQNSEVPTRVVKTHLTLHEAKTHCKDPETSSRTATSVAARKLTEAFGPWFDAYTEERR